MNFMMHNRKILFIYLVGLFGQICAGLNYNRIDSAFDNRYNTTDPYNPALLYAFGQRQAVFYQIALNISDASVVDLANIIVSSANNYYLIHKESFNISVQGSTVNSIGRVFDPCVFASPPSTATLTFNGTTDAKEGHISCVIGALEVPVVQNATAFEYTNPAILNTDDAGTDAFVASRFYVMNFNVSENESWGLEATSTEDISLSVAGFGNCPSYKFTNDSVYWTGQLSGNQTVNTPVVAVMDKSFLWLQVTSQKSATVTLTWKQLPSTPGTPSNEPVTGPSSIPSDDLPQWATALLILFGLVIGVLVVIVIVLCVKNRRRATYQGV